MKIVSQSQAPTKAGYVHLAYISAALSNGISKAELLPMQVVLGLAVATAMGCAALRVKMGRKGRSVRAAIIGAVLMLALYKTAEALWISTLSNEQVAKHIIKTDQYWALREKPIAAAVESVALTNGRAASLAAKYYTLSRHQDTNTATIFLVKSYYYAQLALANGQKSPWLRVDELDDKSMAYHFQIQFQDALEKRILRPTEQEWATQQVARLKLLADTF